MSTSFRGFSADRTFYAHSSAAGWPIILGQARCLNFHLSILAEQMFWWEDMFMIFTFFVQAVHLFICSDEDFYIYM